MKTVYTCFATDVIHAGHINIINEAKKYGRVVVGCLSDKASIRYNRFPTVSEEQRIRIYGEIDGVDSVILQNDMFYEDVIESLHPDYVIHGDNWCRGPESSIRARVIELVSAYGGEVIDVPYTFNEEVRKVDMQIKEKLSMPE